MAECSFCGRTGVKMSREHVLPEWLSVAGASGGEYLIERSGRTVRSSILNVVTRRVCLDCNTGWMSRIEHQTKPVFTGLLDASSTKISEIDRWILARWFTKTLLTAQLALTARDAEGPAQPQDYQAFYGRPQPFNNQLTLIAGYQGPLLPIILEVHSPGEASNRGTGVFFQFHRVVLLAFFMDLENQPTTIRVPQGFLDASHVLWPMQRGFIGSGDPTVDLSWPPSFILDEAAIAHLRAAMLS